MAQLKDTSIDGALDVLGISSFSGNFYAHPIDDVFSGREILCPINSEGNTTFNYGSYEGAEGGTNIYGHNLSLISNNTIKTERPVQSHAVLARSAEVVALSTSHKRPSLSFYNQVGNQDEIFQCVTSPYKGVKCNLAGRLLVAAGAHVKDITGGNSVGLVVYKNDLYYGTITYDTSPTARTYADPVYPPMILSVSEGDIIGLGIYNLQSATGQISDDTSCRLFLQYLE